MNPDRLIVIDGYNLILRSAQLRPGAGRTLREARAKLLNLLAWAVGGEARFLVIFDGAEGGAPDRTEGRVEVRYARPPLEADDLIRQVVEKEVDRYERVTVVTADLEVARHARGAGADVSLADLFLASVVGPAPAEPSEKPSQLSRRELEEWAEIFKAPRPRAADDDSEP